MCGILFHLQVVSEQQEKQENEFKELQELIEFNGRRGPDAAGKHSWQIKIENGPEKTVHMELHGWVLHLRGDTADTQPLQDSDGNILGFNGEVYGGLDIQDAESDTKALLRSLQQCRSEKEILECISKLQAEYALVYYRADLKCIYFGRDCLGRRSLLWNGALESTSELILASVQTKLNHDSNDIPFTEVPTTGLFRVQVDRLISPMNELQIESIPWETASSSTGLSTYSRTLVQTIPTESDLIACHDPFILPEPPSPSAVTDFESRLADAVCRRVNTIPPPQIPGSARLGILFSGGIDCMMIAALAHRFLPEDEPIDLLNVGFENPRILNVQPSIVKNKTKTKKKNILQDDSKKAATPFTTEKRIPEEEDLTEEQKKYNVPDRKTGRLGYTELSSLYPTRTWRFVEINVPYEEAQATRDHIRKLIYPSETVMDLSIAIAFWFASRGLGLLATTGEEYVSKARVLFSGLGADEQLGGYGRHKVAFNKGSWKELIKELQLDVDRIPSRNLGRDDRIISDHGKEVRFPFLDEQVVQYLCSLPVHIKTDPRFEKGFGDKMLIRHLASHLGLSRASKEPKRAVQFGARTAKMEISSGRQKGDEVL